MGTAMEATGEATEATTDPTATTAMEATEATMVATTDPTAMATMARGLLMRPPLPSLAPTLMLRLTPGTDTTATDTTGHMDMDIMVLATVDTTGDKSGPQQQHPIFSCRLISKTPVFAKQFSF